MLMIKALSSYREIALEADILLVYEPRTSTPRKKPHAPGLLHPPYRANFIFIFCREGLDFSAVTAGGGSAGEDFANFAGQVVGSKGLLDEFRAWVEHANVDGRVFRVCRHIQHL